MPAKSAISHVISLLCFNYFDRSRQAVRLRIENLQLFMWDNRNFDCLFQLFTLSLKFANFIPKFDLNPPTAVWVCRLKREFRMPNNLEKYCFLLLLFCLTIALFSFETDLAGILAFIILL